MRTVLSFQPRGPKIEMGWKFLLATLLAFGLATTGEPITRAAEVEFLDGQVKGAFDTTISVGVSVRVEDRDDALIGIGNGGTATSLNVDDGNLNYKAGDITSAASKVIHELELQWGNFGFFGRAFYFYDVLVTDTERTKLSETAEGRSVRDITLLDAYGVGNFEVRGSPVTVRLGNQVISWGESTFIQNSINTINPVDVSKLRVAGAELREALLPVPALDVSIGLTDTVSVEAFYQVGWRRTELDPKGTFFSNNDFISPGGTFVIVGGGGKFSDNPPTATTFTPRAGDRNARDFGEFGVAFRYFEPALYDTEFGLYYIHYHSRLPLISATASAQSPIDARYFTEYPDDIDLLGASFNSELGATGYALQGEISYRFDQPLQIDDQEILVAALDFCGRTGPGGGIRASQLDKDGDTIGCGFEPDEDVTGFRTKDVLQVQGTVTKIIGPTFGVDQIVLLGEAGLTWVPDLESKGVLRYDGPGTFNSGDAGTAAATPVPTQLDGFADDTSWGYRLLGRLVFNNAIGPVSLEPQIAFAHDVHGTTPSPVANFVEDRKTVTLSLKATYLNTWQGRISYTNFFGAGSFNLRNDRDFVSTVISYSF